MKDNKKMQTQICQSSIGHSLNPPTLLKKSMKIANNPLYTFDGFIQISHISTTCTVVQISITWYIWHVAAKKKKLDLEKAYTKRTRVSPLVCVGVSGWGYGPQYAYVHIMYMRLYFRTFPLYQHSTLKSRICIHKFENRKCWVYSCIKAHEFQILLLEYHF